MFMKAINLVALVLGLVVVPAWSMDMTAMEWMASRSVRANTLGEWVSEIGLAAPKEKEILKSLEKRGLKSTAMPPVDAQGKTFKVYGQGDKPMVVVEARDKGVFKVNGVTVGAEPGEAFEKIVMKVERALKGENTASVFDLMVPKANAVGHLFLAGIGVGAVAIGGWGVWEMWKGPDAEKIAKAVEGPQKNARIKKFECDSDNRLKSWAINHRDVETNLEFTYESAAAGKVSYVEAGYTCHISWHKKDASVVVLPQDFSDQGNTQICNGITKSGGKLRDASVFKGFAPYDDLQKCCGDKTCREQLAKYLKLNPETRPTMNKLQRRLEESGAQ
jgi:hypothetical protein